MKQVMTVRGPVDSSKLGIILPHEHLLFDLFRVFQPQREFKIMDAELAGSELQQYVNAGGSTIVEVTTIDLARDHKSMLAISERTGANIIMSTGWYREPFYSPDIWHRTTKDLTKQLVDEIKYGIDGIRPGIIGEIGTHHGFVSPVEEKVHRAAARAHLETGLAITLHSNATNVGLAQLDVLEEEGVDLSKVVVGHCDTYPKLDHHLALLDRGAWVEFDTIRGTFEYETKMQIKLITDLISRGFLSRILLSQDLGSNRLLTAYGGNGFAYLITTFRQRLLDAGLINEQIVTLIEDNPRRMLVGE